MPGDWPRPRTGSEVGEGELGHLGVWMCGDEGFGVYPEDHLWWATRGSLDLDEAIDTG